MTGSRTCELAILVVKPFPEVLAEVAVGCMLAAAEPDLGTTALHGHAEPTNGGGQARTRVPWPLVPAAEW